jgi:hypothetical protein
LNQIEVYRANVKALHRYRRQSLNGHLRSLEIFETVRPGITGALELIDWSTFWNGYMRRQHAGQGLRGHDERQE